MIEYHFRPDGSMETSGTADTFLENISDNVLTREANIVLRENNPVGVASGYYDEKLTMVSLSEFFLSDLGYSEDDFVKRTGASLTEIMVSAPLFPFSVERFRALQGTGCFYMSAADGTPRLMYVVKHDITDETGRRQWVMSIRCDAHSQNLALVNELIDNAYWSVDYTVDGRVKSVQWSDRLRELLGLADDKTLPADESVFREMLCSEDRGAADEFFTKTIPQAPLGTDSFEAEFRLSVGGHYEWFRTRAHVVRRHDGTVCRTTGILCNVNEEKLTDERELRHETFLRAFSDGNLCEFFVDLETDRCECYNCRRLPKGLVTETGGWRELTRHFADRGLKPEDRPAFLQLTEADYIRTALKVDAGELTGQFEVVADGGPPPLDPLCGTSRGLE